MIYFKVLADEHGKPNVADTDFRYPLPRGDKPGKWTPIIKKLIPYQSGYHLCQPDDLIYWLGRKIYIAEPGDKIIQCDRKVITERVRLLWCVEAWNERTARLFACDCAERSLKFFEKQYPKDNRLREVINIARKYANGKATIEDLRAARSVAYAAYLAADSAYSAADSEAYSADLDDSAYSAYSATYAAYVADSADLDDSADSDDSAYLADDLDDSASYAADSAYSAVRKEQTKLLFKYIQIDYKKAVAA